MPSSSSDSSIGSKTEDVHHLPVVKELIPIQAYDHAELLASFYLHSCWIPSSNEPIAPLIDNADIVKPTFIQEAKKFFETYKFKDSITEINLGYGNRVLNITFSSLRNMVETSGFNQNCKNAKNVNDVLAAIADFSKSRCAKKEQLPALANHLNPNVAREGVLTSEVKAPNSFSTTSKNQARQKK